MLRTLGAELKAAGGWKLAAVAAPALVFTIFLYRSDWPFYRNLRDRGRAGDGWVTVKGLGAKDDISYSYEVDHRTYGGVGKAGYGNLEFDKLKPGDRVLVFYLPENPAVHCLGDPLEHLRDQNRAMFLPLALVAGALGLLISRELKKNGP